MEDLVYLQNVMSLGIFALGCIFLFLRSRGSRFRKILAFIVLLWSMDYLVRLLDINLRGAPVLIDDFFSPFALIFGTLLVISMIPFVYEIVRPGWLTWRRGLALLLPWLSLSVFYMLMLFVLQEPVDKLENFDELWLYVHRFNVWFRFILFLQIFYYLFVLHRVALRYQSYYDEWCCENYSSMEKLDISWLKYLAFGMLGITIGFAFILFDMGVWSYVFHQIAVQFVFAVCLYKGLFHENPYPEKFFKNTLDEETALLNNSHDEYKKAVVDSGFSDSLPAYRLTVEEWLAKAQPFLRQDFKLTDVAEVLPLNRSYLSRVFNEGFGASFSQVVQNYRVEKAKGLLVEEPGYSIQEVSYKSGFASGSSFHAIFLKKTGMTPKAYRETNQIKHQ